MKATKILAAVTGVAALTFFAVPATAGDDPVGAGLQAVESKVLDEVRVAADADFSGYERVYLAPAQIEFRKNWLRDQNRQPGTRIRDEDVGELRDDLAALVGEVFTEELEQAGFVITDDPSADALTLHVNIVELDIVAPDLPSASTGRTFQYSQSAGEMTLDLLVEADGNPLAEIRDRKRDFQQGWFEWRTRVSNRADAKRWLRSWARAVSEGLANSNWDGAR